MYQYEVVPVMVTGGVGGAEAGSEWATLRAGLNERGRLGFRVVAVSEGPEGRAVIMERAVGEDSASRGATASARSVSQAAEEITRESAEPGGARQCAPPDEPGR
jgi:hypothetical protein